MHQQLTTVCMYIGKKGVDREEEEEKEGEEETTTTTEMAEGENRSHV